MTSTYLASVSQSLLFVSVEEKPAKMFCLIQTILNYNILQIWAFLVSGRGLVGKSENPRISTKFLGYTFLLVL